MARCPAPKGAMQYFVDTAAWAEREGVEWFHFAAFDEAWKVGAEGDVGAFWGLWDKDASPSSDDCEHAHAAVLLPQGNAICYSGYREGQSPDLKRYPSVAQIREDLHLLARHWQLLRLYDCSVHAERVLQVIREDRLPLRVMLGAYLGPEMNNFGCPWGGTYTEAHLEASRRENAAELERLFGSRGRTPTRCSAWPWATRPRSTGPTISCRCRKWSSTCAA